MPFASVLNIEPDGPNAADPIPPNFRPTDKTELPELLDAVQWSHGSYFWSGADADSGLPFDRLHVRDGASSDLISIGGVGFGLLAIVVMASRGWLPRSEAARRVDRIIASLERVPRFKGAFPHFVRRDFSVVPLVPCDDGGDLVETALLAQGLICAREFFSFDEPEEIGVRVGVNRIVGLIEWANYVRPDARRSLYWHWSPKHFWTLNTPITGWNEALVAYVLAAGSEAFPIDREVFRVGWANEGNHRNGTDYYGHRLPAGVPFGGPLFLSQYSFCALDPRSLRDNDIQYWDQAVAHSRINFEHCRRNPNGHIGYGTYGWGLTASDGPKGYLVSCPVNDHGVLAPTAALSSFPFVPQESEMALRSFLRYGNGRLWTEFGFVDSFAPSQNWVSEWRLAINQGPVVAMIENFRSGLLWRLFMNAPEIKRGLDRLSVNTQ